MIKDAAKPGEDAGRTGAGAAPMPVLGSICAPEVGAVASNGGGVDV